MDIKVRRAAVEDAADFAELVLMSSPALFPAVYGDDAKAVIQRLFCHTRNLFSFEHTYFAEVSGSRAGMLLKYDWNVRRRENWRTGLLMLREMKLEFVRRVPRMIKVESVLGKVKRGELYISNVAIYPEYRSQGVGSRLIFQAEREAGATGMRFVSLEVEAGNAGAIKLYSRLGYSIVSECTFRLGGSYLNSFRMRKELQRLSEKV
jgi:ribosomal protein S18 acetylase RimI-like enzyme